MKPYQQLTLPLSVPRSFQEDDFIQSPTNWEAFTWIERWPDWPMQHLAIYGEQGGGKSHLARIYQKKANARLLSPTCTLGQPLLLCQAHKAFVIDDYDQIQDEEWLFHFYNITREKKAFVLYLGRQAPGHSLFLLPDLRSRMRSIHSVAIQSPDDDLLKKLLERELESRGLTLTSDVCEYILKRVERSYASIHDLIEKIDQHTLTHQKALTLFTVRDVLLEGDV